MAKVSGAVISEIRRILQHGRKRKVVQLSAFLRPKDVRTVDELIKMGYDPVHAAYTSAENVLSCFCEAISGFSALEEFYNIAEPAIKEYMPSGPPWSPLSQSYFTCWLYLDVLFGPNNECIASCLIDAFQALVPFPAKEIDFMLNVIDIMLTSRMGIYEHCGLKGKYAILKELVSEKEEVCLVPVDYSGRKGELWFVRVLPSIYGDRHYSLVFTTPYILQGPGKKEWLSYFRETLPKMNTTSDSNAFNLLMKYGLTRLYWPEYIFNSYCGNTSEAIFLRGLPKSSLRVEV